VKVTICSFSFGFDKNKCDTDLGSMRFQSKLGGLNYHHTNIHNNGMEL